ncbi:protein kinase [Pendulispora brunnea]|uniref:Protein kinase n=1 Tax=Pendulispora brunnea TaxID=2905690 RepID=A0ABZ2KC30_9BACT
MIARSSIPEPMLMQAAGRYRHILELGRGGMADIVLAVVQGPGGFNKLQVVKLLRKELSSDSDFCTMFLDEARLAARINHPNVVQTNEVGFDGERYFMAMEYLEGQNLDHFMKAARASGGIPLGIFLRVLCDVCQGLHFAHELRDFDGASLNVVHRDISPQNVFITYSGTTKVLDFGIAKANDSNTETQAGTFKGKVAYMAPEQIVARNEVDRRADIFAVGTILWRAVTGKRMWSDLSELEILHKLASEDIPEPVALEGVPSKLVDICRRATAADIDDRYKTAAEICSALEEVLATLPHATHADVGALISDLFAEHAQKVREAIDARLASAVSSVSPMNLPPFPVTSHSAVLPLSTGRGVAAGDGERLSVRVELKARRLFAASGAVLALAALLVFGGRILSKSSLRADLHAASGANVAQAVKHAPATTVRLDSQPSEATVEKDGAVLGHTPLTVDLPPGAQSLVVTRDGYYEETLNIDVPADATEPIQRVLTLRSKASPSGADASTPRARFMPNPRPGAGPQAMAKSQAPSAEPPPAPPPPSATTTHSAEPSKPKVKIVDDNGPRRKITVITDS